MKKLLEISIEKALRLLSLSQCSPMRIQLRFDLKASFGTIDLLAENLEVKTPVRSRVANHCFTDSRIVKVFSL